jgi:hypothetical protein
MISCHNSTIVPTKDHIINAGTVDVATKAHEEAITEISASMVISAQIFDLCLQQPKSK